MFTGYALYPKTDLWDPTSYPTGRACTLRVHALSWSNARRPLLLLKVKLWAGVWNKK